MFGISIGESDRRRGGMMLPSMWNAAGITSSEAQVCCLIERAGMLLLAGTFLRRGGNASCGYCGSVASREAVRRELGEGRCESHDVVPG